MVWVILFMGLLSIAFMLEGMAPLMFPEQIRRRLAQIAEMTPGQLRFVGLLLAFVTFLILLFADFGD